MSDFDQKEIPILDDIIDDDEIDDAEADAAETVDSLDLFAGETGDSAAETEPQKDIDNADDIFDKDAANKEIARYSVQCSYEETYSDPAYQLVSKEKDDVPDTDENPDRSNSKFSLDPLTLELAVESVVKQMMPDLEQQLRFLIQQSLEKKLPEAIMILTDDNNGES